MMHDEFVPKQQITEPKRSNDQRSRRRTALCDDGDRGPPFASCVPVKSDALPVCGQCGPVDVRPLRSAQLPTPAIGDPRQILDHRGIAIARTGTCRPPYRVISQATPAQVLGVPLSLASRNLPRFRSRSRATGLTAPRKALSSAHACAGVGAVWQKAHVGFVDCSIFYNNVKVSIYFINDKNEFKKFIY